MMISLAHTEGQLGRVQEAVKAFDLQQWLATVQGPLVDGLEQKMVAAQRRVVREEVEKWARQIESRQAERLATFTSFMNETKTEMVGLGQAVDRVDESLKRMEGNNESFSRKYEEGIRPELVALHQQSKEIKEQLTQSAQPFADLRAELEGVKQENQELRKWLEDRSAAAEEFRAQVRERLESVAEASADQMARAEEQIAESAKRWQGLFLTLRENHEAQLQTLREAVNRLEDERAQALERVENAEAERRRQETSRIERTKQSSGNRVKELIEFCSRRPESVLCRDLEVR